MLPKSERVEVTSRAEWRAWLDAHHQQTEGIWLVTYKKHVADKYVAWGEIVQVALCYGWIDSQSARVDAERTMRYVCPRRPGSHWSALNKRHLAELEAAGLIHTAGYAAIERAKADGSWTLLDDVEALLVPGDLAAALDANPDAKAHYEAFRPTQKKAILWWIKSAKRPATRARRLARAVEKAADNEVAP